MDFKKMIKNDLELRMRRDADHEMLWDSSMGGYYAGQVDLMEMLGIMSDMEACDWREVIEEFNSQFNKE